MDVSSVMVSVRVMVMSVCAKELSKNKPKVEIAIIAASPANHKSGGGVAYLST